MLSWLSLSSRTLESSSPSFRLPCLRLSRSGDASGDSSSRLRGDGAREDTRRVPAPDVSATAAASAAAGVAAAAASACASAGCGVDAAADPPACPGQCAHPGPHFFLFLLQALHLMEPFGRPRWFRGVCCKGAGRGASCIGSGSPSASPGECKGSEDVGAHLLMVSRTCRYFSALRTRGWHTHLEHRPQQQYRAQKHPVHRPLLEAEKSKAGSAAALGCARSR